MKILLVIRSIIRMNTYSAVITAMILLATFLLCPSAFALTAQTIKNYGDITVMALEGNYDSTLGNGQVNSAAREIISREFYKTRADEFDFIVIFTNFDFQISFSHPDAVAFYLGVRNDIQGIGRHRFDNSNFFGSDGVLQGTIDMGNLKNWVVDPMEKDFSFLMATLSHELMHRWAASPKIQRSDGSITTDLLGQDQEHWSFLLDTQGSLMYGNPWQVNNDGTFTSLKGRKYYSPLDLYLMGLVDKSEVPSMLLIDSPETDATRVSKPGVTISGTARYVSIDDIIAAEGERVPDYINSQKNFKIGCVFITRPNTFTGKELSTIRIIMDNWVVWHSSLTHGKSMIGYRDNPLAALPYNPGPDTSTRTPRTTPPEISEGVGWLVDQQQSDGSWMDAQQTLERDTTCAIGALANYSGAEPAVSYGMQWIDILQSSNFDYLARKIITLVDNGEPVEPLINVLAQRQLDDGGWGVANGYTSNPTDTSIVLVALSAAGVTDTQMLANAVNYLVAQQNNDGGWGSNKVVSDIHTTAKVIIALKNFRDEFVLHQTVGRGFGWLQSKNNSDGGFGEIESTVYDTANVLIAFKTYNLNASYASALQYLFDLQSDNGSWYDSVYQTALAIQALRACEDHILSDLSVTTTDITFSPDTLIQRPQLVAIDVKVHNSGFKAVDNVVVAIYDGIVIPENFIARQTISVAARSNATAAFTTSFDDTLDHFIFAAVDPEYLVDEANKNNNTAFAILMNELNMDPDLQVQVGDMTFEPATVRRIPEQVELTALVHNTGVAPVPQVGVICYRDEMITANIVGQQQIAVGAQSSTPVMFNFTVTDGDLHRYFLVVDPEELVLERNEYNNLAIRLHEPEVTHDFSFGSPSIALTSAAVVKDQTVGITVRVTNIGTRNAYNVPVRLYIDDNGTIFEIATLTTDIPFSGGATLQTEWVSNHTGNNFRVYAQIDPQNAFSEVSETNNLAFEILSVTERPEPNLTLTHNDITITPSPANEAGDATIVARLQNNGSSATDSVDVAFTWNQVGGSPQPLGRAAIPALASGEVAQVSFPLSNINVFGDWLINVSADPDNQIVEVSEDDNSAFKSLAILSLPELSIGTGSIGFSPTAPSEGDVVAVTILVQNSGGQDAVNVPVVLFDGPSQVGSASLATIAGNSQATISFSFDTSGGPGVHSLRCVVDPDNTILEKRKDNNVAVRTLGVQNGDLWLSQQYVSADGGLNNMSTTFFFRLDYPTNVTVVIVNSRGRIVRTFAGPELENTTGTTVTWDGRNDRGMVVADGDYQIQVRDLNDNVLRSLPTTMDNNLSPLAEAIGTEYLFHSNISCMLPDIHRKQWFSDESGLVFYVKDADPDTPEYPSGLYTMAPDGEDIQRLVPWQWAIGTDPNYNYTYATEDGIGKGFYLSEDNAGIAFILQKHDPENSPSETNLLETQIYVADRFGEAHTLIDSATYRLASGTDHPFARIRSLVWSDDGNWIAYRTTVGRDANVQEELYLIRSDGTEKTILPVLPEEKIQFLSWSPESQRLLYTAINESTSESTVHTFDPSGQADYVLYQTPSYIKDVQWINPDKIVCVTRDEMLDQESVLILDSMDQSSVAEALVLDPEDRLGNLQIHPYGEGFGFIYHRNVDVEYGGYGGYGGGGWSESDGYASVRYCDDSGQCDIVHESKAFFDFESVTDLSWSKDGYRLSFVDRLYQEVEPCRFAAHLVTMEWEDRNKNAFAVSYPVLPLEYQGGGGTCSYHIWSRENGLWMEKTVLHYGSEFESQTAPLPQLGIEGDGKVALRITQTGTDVANIDAVSLVVEGQSFKPARATIVGTDLNILSRIQTEDGISADVTAATIELEWTNIPEGQSITLAMNANEYNNQAGSSTDDGDIDPDAPDDPTPYPEVDFYSGTLKWLDGGDYLIGQDSQGHFSIDADSGHQVYFDIDPSQQIELSPRSRYITYRQGTTAESVCYGRGETDLWTMQSLLNLTADLRVMRENLTASITFKATATDLNFDNYFIEYADLQTPNDWTIIKPPVRAMVLDEVIYQWLPPGPGTYLVKLTATDLAGHIKTEQKRVAWGLTSPIGNLYLDDEYVSANGDGVKDSLLLNYTVYEPVHLEFYILDANNTRVATLYRDYADIPTNEGRDALYWDGRTDSGHIAEDGQYRIEVLGIHFPFIMDRTLPEASVSLSEILVSSDNNTKDKMITIIEAQLSGTARDVNLAQWVLEYGQGDNPQQWFTYAGGIEELPENIADLPTKNYFATLGQGQLGHASGKKYRLTVEDKAGNKNIQTTEVLEEVLILTQWKGLPGWFNPGPCKQGKGATHSILFEEILPQGFLGRADNGLEALMTYRSPAQVYTVQYRNDLMEWEDGPQPTGGPSGVITLNWNAPPPYIPNVNAVRVRAQLTSGQVVYSDPLPTKLVFELQEKSGDINARVLPFEELISLRASSISGGQGPIVDQGKSWESADGDVIPYGEFELYSQSEVIGLSLVAGDTILLEGVGVSGRRYWDEYIIKSDRQNFKIKKNFICDLENQTYQKQFIFSRNMAELSSLHISVVRPDFTLPEPLESVHQVVGSEVPGAGRAWDKHLGDTIPGDTIPDFLVLWTADDWPEPDLQSADVIVVEGITTEGRRYADLMTVGPDFHLLTCCFEETGAPIQGVIKDIPNLTYLRFEMNRVLSISHEETVLIKEWRTDSGDTIPQGVFQILDPSEVSPSWIGAKFRYRLIGQTSQGETHYHFETKEPAVFGGCALVKETPKFDVDLTVSPQKATACDTLSPSQVSLVTNVQKTPEPSYPLASLRYYVQRFGQWHLLQHQDLTTEQWTPAVVDTYAVNEDGIYLYEEGEYRVNVIAVDINGYVADYCGSTLNCPTFTVDRVMPDAAITTPAPAAEEYVCPIISEAQGRSPLWYIDLGALAQDDRQLYAYQIFYAYEATPDQWHPALDLEGRHLAGAGKGTVMELFGQWNVTQLMDEHVLLKLEVTDEAGNMRCDIRPLKLDIQRELTVTAGERLFSPNGDGHSDAVTIDFTVEEVVTVDAAVMGPSNEMVKNILTGLPHDGGEGRFTWDGADNVGQYVPDGVYTIRLTVTDRCGNATTEWIEAVEVDRTSPTTEIAFPQPDDTLGTIVEVIGTADDPHFAWYRLEVLDETHPEPLQTLANEELGVQNGQLGRWNTFGAQGRRILRLTAADSVGNTSQTQTTIDLGVRQNLIVDLGAQPPLFSPNNDGRMETVSLTYELNADLNQSFNALLEIIDGSQTVIRSFTLSNIPGGAGHFTWDGLNTTGLPAPDGVYQAVLTASFTANPSITHKEVVTLVLDATAPLIELTSPQDHAVISEILMVQGAVTDTNLDNYTLTLTGPSGPQTVDQGQTNRQNHLFAGLDNLEDGPYTIDMHAMDRGQNEAAATLSVIVDKTAPQLRLDAPQIDEGFGHQKQTISIVGQIVEKNIEQWQLRYRRQDAAPDSWTLLTQGDAVPTAPLHHTWPVDADAGIADGNYIISLYAIDKAGWEAAYPVAINIDNTAPQVAVSAPVDGGYIKEPITIEGTVADTNLLSYSVSAAQGECAAAYQWSPINSSATGVTDGILAQWQVLPPDDRYCLRVTAQDQIGHVSEVKQDLVVDTHPPAAPVLSAELEDRINARLTWTGSSEPDLAGYNVYRNGQKRNAQILPSATYLDAALEEGNYQYTIRAVDQAGWESESSNIVTLGVDLTPPVTRIRVPESGVTVSEQVDIKGTAYSDDDFKEFRLYVGQGSNPTHWQLLHSSAVATSYGTLGQWETTGLTEGAPFSLRLEAEDLSGNVGEHRIEVTIDNQAPAAPVLVSVEAQGLSSNDVDVIWQPNTETDLAGYLLYRNGELANVIGTVIGELAPYLLSVTAYTDPELADGTYEYDVIAMDNAGNLSVPSNRRSVNIDTRTPRALIVAPGQGYTFDQSFLIRAICEDLDVATVRIQYKTVAATDWEDVNAPLTELPYATYLNPTDLGMGYGDYQLRAVAADTGGRSDTEPPFITVEYKDITPPATPIELQSAVAAGQVTLTWTANTETDLAGYDLFQVTPNGRTRLNDALITEPTYIHLDNGEELPDGHYQYQVEAVDQTDNRSAGSDIASATVYTPLLEQPYSPTDRTPLHLYGQTAPDHTVRVFRDTGNGFQDMGTITADDQGNFFYDWDLAPGENRISVIASDVKGNTSKPSPEVVVAHGTPPAAPVGLEGTVIDHDCTLTWTPNTEADLAGYNLFRNGVKQNNNTLVTNGIAGASVYDYRASNASDGNNTSYWYAYSQPQGIIWWQLQLPAAVMISRVELRWYSSYYAAGKYELQVWSGHTWIPLVKVMDNQQFTGQFDILPAYVTDRIRLVIPSDGMPFNSSVIRLSEFNLWQSNPIAHETFLDLNVADGTHEYHLEAVNTLGMVSPLSDPVGVDIGDVTAPDAVTLSAATDVRTIHLNWTPSDASDLAGYYVYKQVENQWLRMNESPVTATTYADPDLPNSTFTYRVTAVDLVSNESEPSNAASATVNQAPPPQPVSVTATSLPQGGVIQVCWDAVADATGYRLYRSTSSGGPYEQVTSELITATCYQDTGLVDGTTYFYMVHAVDTFGNESDDSLEGSAVPADLTPPGAPVFSDPTVAGYPITVASAHTNIDGWAEPGATVELMRDDFLVMSSQAETDDIISSFPLENIPGYYYGEGAVSPDGQFFAVQYYYWDDTVYDYVYQIWIYDLTTGAQQIITINASASGLTWSPDSHQVAFQFYADGNKIAIYDCLTRQTALVTQDQEYYHDQSPVWSSDGKTLVFSSNRLGGYDIFAYRLADQSVEQWTDNQGAQNPQLSADGRYLTYVAEQSLYMVDLQAGQDPQRIADNLSFGFSHAWASSGSTLAFVNNADLHTLSPDDGTPTQVTTSGDVQQFNRLPGDRHFGLVRRINDQRSYWVIDTTERHMRRVETAGMFINQIKHDANGAIYLLDQFSGELRELSKISLAGRFRMNNVPLTAGQNLFTATARDVAGNHSPVSEGIVINVTADQLPDIVITPADLFHHPHVPLDGDPVLFTAIVHNDGFDDAEDVTVEFSIWDSNDTTEVVHSTIIAHLAAGGQTLVQFEWDSTGMAGKSALVADVDLDDHIFEASETNNMAFIDFYVAADQGLHMATELAYDLYGADEQVDITVELYNTQQDRNVTVAVEILDADQQPVASVDTVNFQLPYSPLTTWAFIWNTGRAQAGDYYVRSILSDESGQLAENMAPFTIEATVAVAATVITDRSHYLPHETAQMHGLVTNQTPNMVLTDITFDMTVRDTDGQIVHQQDGAIDYLFADTPVSVDATWNVGVSAAGLYTATLTVNEGATILAQAESAFHIDAVSHLEGSLSVQPAVTTAGAVVSVDYLVSQLGNAAVSGLPLTIAIVSPDTQSDLDTDQISLDIDIGAAVSDTVLFDTSGYANNHYPIQLRYDLNGETIVLAEGHLTVNSPIDLPVDLSGTLSADPARATVGTPVTLNYTVTNEGQQTISALVIQITVPEGLSGDYERTIVLPSGATIAGAFVVPTDRLIAQNHTSELLVRLTGVLNPSELANTSYTVAAPEPRVHAPVAIAGGPYLAAVDETIQVDGSTSFDLDEGQSDTGQAPFDTIIAYDWEIHMVEPYDFDDAAGATAELPAFDTPGLHTIALRVTDNTEAAFPSEGLADMSHTGFADVKVYSAEFPDLSTRWQLTTISLIWTHIGAETYEILRSQTGPNSGFETIGTTSCTYSFYTDESIVLNQNYWYRVRCVMGDETRISEAAHVINTGCLPRHHKGPCDHVHKKWPCDHVHKKWPCDHVHKKWPYDHVHKK